MIDALAHPSPRLHAAAPPAPLASSRCRQQTAHWSAQLASGSLMLSVSHSPSHPCIPSASLPFVVDWLPSHRRVTSGGIHDRRALTLWMRAALERSNSCDWAWQTITFDPSTFARRFH
jgi:hypothetical protein